MQRTSELDNVTPAGTGTVAAAAAPASRTGSAVAAAGSYRWTICALLFLATTCNYMDRQVLSLLAPDLQKVFGWNDVGYGYINTAFQAAYALGLPAFGWIIDRIGIKRGYAASITLWSLAACATALARSAVGFGIARVALGLSEAGNFPAAIKAVAEWFPKRERALATGLFNSGANVGAILAPATVPLLALNFGWQAAFIAVGAVGFLWVLLWGALYQRPEENRNLSQEELTYIRSDASETNPAARTPWASLLGVRQTWGIVFGKFLTDPIWWFFLSWLPKFFHDKHQLNLSSMGLPLVVIYTMSTIGSIGGGWLSGFLIRSGWTVDRSRKAAFLLCAVCVVPIILAAQVSSLWTAVLLIGLAAAAHQGWSATVFTTVSDIFPRRAVGSVTGIAGMAGSIGGMLFQAGAGWLLLLTHENYYPLFLISGLAYLTAFALFSAFVPRIEPVQIAQTS